MTEKAKRELRRLTSDIMTCSCGGQRLIVYSGLVCQHVGCGKIVTELGQTELGRSVTFAQLEEAWPDRIVDGITSGGIRKLQPFL